MQNCLLQPRAEPATTATTTAPPIPAIPGAKNSPYSCPWTSCSSSTSCTSREARSPAYFHFFPNSGHRVAGLILPPSVLLRPLPSSPAFSRCSRGPPLPRICHAVTLHCCHRRGWARACLGEEWGGGEDGREEMGGGSSPGGGRRRLIGHREADDDELRRKNLAACRRAVALLALRTKMAKENPRPRLSTGGTL